MDNVVGLLGEILKKAREDGTTDRVERYMLQLAEKVGLTPEEIQFAEDVARQYGPAQVYYP